MIWSEQVRRILGPIKLRCWGCGREGLLLDHKGEVTVCNADTLLLVQPSMVEMKSRPWYFTRGKK